MPITLRLPLPCPGCHISPPGTSAPAQWCCSRASLQLPTSLPCLAVAAVKPGPSVSPDSSPWSCTQLWCPQLAPLLEGAVGQALAARTCHDIPGEPLHFGTSCLRNTSTGQESEDKLSLARIKTFWPSPSTQDVLRFYKVCFCFPSGTELPRSNLIVFCLLYSDIVWYLEERAAATIFHLWATSARTSWSLVLGATQGLGCTVTEHGGQHVHLHHHCRNLQSRPTAVYKGEKIDPRDLSPVSWVQL